MIAILGWVLFAATLVVAVWRDVRRLAKEVEREAEYYRYLKDKSEDWLAEKQSYLARIDMLKRDHRNYQHNVAKLRKACAIIEATYDEEQGS